MIDDDKHLNAFVRAPNGQLVILGEAGTILLSAGRRQDLVARSPSPYKGSLFGGLVADDGAVVAFGLRGRIFRSTDAGRTWKPVDNASAATLMGGSKLPDGALVIAGAGGTVLVLARQRAIVRAAAHGEHQGVLQGGAGRRPTR